MALWNKFAQAKWGVKAVLIFAAVSLTLVLLAMPLFSVEAEDTLSRSGGNPNLALMARQEATGGILLLGSVLVLVIVGGTLRILSQDRQHRPYLLQDKGKKSKKDIEAEKE